MTCNQNCRQGRDCNRAGWHVVPLTPEYVAVQGDMLLPANAEVSR